MEGAGRLSAQSSAGSRRFVMRAVMTILLRAELGYHRITVLEAVVLFDGPLRPEIMSAKISALSVRVSAGGSADVSRVRLCALPNQVSQPSAVLYTRGGRVVGRALARC